MLKVFGQWVTYCPTELCYTFHCSGMLTGKFSRDTVPNDPSSSRVAWVEEDPKKRAVQSQPSYSQYADDDKYWALIDVMKEIAKKHNATVAQVAIAWLLKQPTVTSVLLGARTKQQLADNLASVNVNLTDEEVIVLAYVAVCLVWVGWYTMLVLQANSA